MGAGGSKGPNTTFQQQGNSPDTLMGQQSLGYFIAIDRDPSIAPGCFGVKGTIAAWKGPNGGFLYQKQDDGITANWTLIGGSGPIPSIPNPFERFIDATSGDDVANDGTILLPFKSVGRALASIPNDSNTYTIFAYPGNYQAANEPANPIVWKTNANFEGLVANNTVIEAPITYTAGAGDSPVFQFDSVVCQMTLDLALASFSSITFNNGAFELHRMDSNLNGFINIFGALFESEISGRINLQFVFLFGDVTVLPGSIVVCSNGQSIGGNFLLQGNCSLRTTGFNNITPYVDGTPDGSGTPTWLTSADSDQTYTGTVNKTVYGAGGGTFLPSTETRYIDPIIGSDVTGNGSIETPFQTIAQALIDVPTGPLAIMLQQGVYSEPTVNLRTDVGIIGMGVVQAISITNPMSYVAGAGDTVGLEFVNVNLAGGLTLDDSAAASGTVAFFQCIVGNTLTRTGGLAVMQARDSYFNLTDLVGTNIFLSSVILDVFTLQPNSQTSLINCVEDFGPPPTKIGNALLIKQSTGVNNGAFRAGQENNQNGSILSVSAGSFAVGFSQSDIAGAFSSTIMANGVGSSAKGYSEGLNGNANITSSANGSVAYGAVIAGTLLANGPGSFAFGYVQSDGSQSPSITSIGPGTMAGGYSYADTTFSLDANINASGEGAFAWGVSRGGSISASGAGSVAHGQVLGSSAGFGSIIAQGISAFAIGYCDASATIVVDDYSFVRGYSSNGITGLTTAAITAGNSSFAFGRVTRGGQTTVNNRSFAFVDNQGLGSTVSVSNSGVLFSSVSTSNGNITQNGGLAKVDIGSNSTITAASSFVFGVVGANNGSLDIASSFFTGQILRSAVLIQGAYNFVNGNIGQFMQSRDVTITGQSNMINIRATYSPALTTHTISGSNGLLNFDGFINSSVTSNNFAIIASGSDLNISSDYSATFGVGHVNSSYLCLVAGEYSDIPSSTPGSSVSTDLIFALGNGTSSGSRSNAFSIQKNGKITETGAKKVKIRSSNNAAENFSEQTDYALVLLAGASTVLLPAGEEGLVAKIKNLSGGAITVNPTGGDTIDGAASLVVNSTEASELIYSGGIWYVF